jgi:hypothetical protein
MGVVRIVTGCVLEGRGLILGRDRVFFFSLLRPDRFWPHQATYSFDTRVSSGWQSGRKVKLITILHLMQRLITHGVVLPLPYTSYSRHRDKFTCMINGQVNLVQMILYKVFKLF